MAANQPPGDQPGRLPIDFRPRRSILLPYNDLLIDQGLDQFLPIIEPGFHLGIVLPYAMGPTEPKVLQTDAAGNLLVAIPSSALSGGVFLTDNASNAILVGGFADALGASPRALVVNGLGYLFNNASSDRARSASAANLATTSGLGAALTAPPGQWAVQHSPATGAQATISKGAGAAGVRNVCTGFSFGFSAGVAVAATSMTVNLRDGASGAGTILHSWIYDLPAAIIAPFSVAETGYEIPGSAATAMTLEFTALLANLREFVNLSGHLAS